MGIGQIKEILLEKRKRLSHFKFYINISSQCPFKFYCTKHACLGRAARCLELRADGTLFALYTKTGKRYTTLYAVIVRYHTTIAGELLGSNSYFRYCVELTEGRGWNFS
jgi:hypothetical protein